MLNWLRAFGEGHFGADPERLNWSHVGSLEYQVNLLKQIYDFASVEAARDLRRQ
ncbi:hypothetical protein [Paracoccus amoyensis]|uniref:hypothetical protein n=1 Tax=Paracoccus amoyensis TaxID=2760093 RepID=UPI001CA9B804|nr:hypothetical protein [Paracoccus amoyensis]